MLIPNRDFSRVIPHVRLVAEEGFGLPSNLNKLPQFFSNYDRRMTLLGNRYIDPELWQEGVERLVARRSRMARTNPLSFVIPFHRRATSERKVPAGGGCLQTITFIWVNGRWELHVALRASEITARLIADMLFVKRSVNAIVEEVNFKKWEPKTRIVWDIALASQMKYLVPLYVLFAEGEGQVINEYTSGKPEGIWQNIIWEHFWDTFIYPERITWAQRRKWSEKFLEMTSAPWAKLAKAGRDFK
jgi:hypothetical protein